MKIDVLSVWGDSIAKGIVFDELRGRYALCRESCLNMLSRATGVRVENHAVMGQTSEVGLMRMRAAALQPGTIAVIEYGGNDCDLDWRAVSEHPDIPQYGKVPLAQFEDNLAQMVECAREAGALPVLVTPPPLIAESYFNWVSKGLSGENILRYLGDVDHIRRWQAGYAARITALSDRLNVYLVDIRSRMLESDRLPELMCRDGIHPNAQGHSLIYEAVAPLLRGAIG